MRSNLPSNLATFSRVLRQMGLPAGPGEVIDAMRAFEAVGVDRRDDVFWALHAVFVRRPEHSELFGLAFHRFWQDPDLPENPMNILPPDRIGLANPEPLPGARRLREAWEGAAARTRPPRERPGLEEHSQVGAYSSTEVLRRKDFEQMSADEIQAAKKVISQMDFAVKPVRTRRWTLRPFGSRIDARASLRASLRTGGDWIPLVRKSATTRPPAVVAICDVSGSMESYSRMLLHFLHALTNARSRVFTFVFGTQLTNITRALHGRDVDVAMATLADEVPDWAGGTRLGPALRQFNRRWSRRVLSHAAVVLLISDGLDQEEGGMLGREAERLNKSCRELIWLNPLLRFEGFEARAQGIVQLLPWVDQFRSAHDLASLEGLGAALNGERHGSRSSANRLASL